METIPTRAKGCWRRERAGDRERLDDDKIYFVITERERDVLLVSSIARAARPCRNAFERIS